MASKIMILFISFWVGFLGFSMEAQAENNNFRFVVMGCMHLGICDFKYYQIAVEEMKKYKPDFVLFLGGMIEPSPKNSIRSQWQKFDTITKEFNTPVYNIPSECQLSFLSLFKNRASLMKEFYLERFKKKFYSFEYKNNLFICLDSTAIFDSSQNKTQLRFLRETLADVSKYDNVFVAIHQSPWFQEKNNEEWFKTIHPLLVGKVKYVFAAHKHFIDLMKVDNIVYLTSGVPPGTETSYSGKSTFFHSLLVKVVNRKVSIKIVPIGGTIAVENLGSSLVEEELSLLNLKSRVEKESKIKPYLLMSYEREFMLKPKQIIKTLKIKTGMKILDVGAGSGFFTFRFADALKNTGMVFATDIDPKLIKLIKEKAKQGGYENITQVLVKPNIAGSFYKNHSFDIIFLSEVYQYLRNPGKYFQELRPSLKKNGRLYIIHSKNVYGFTKVEFGDFKTVIRVLLSKGDTYPVFRKLSKDVQNFTRNWAGQDVPIEEQKEIVRDFNKILSDRFLFYELMDYYADEGVVAGEGEWSAPLELVVHHEDIELSKWLFGELEAGGVFNNERRLTMKEKKYLKKLNRLLLNRTFNLRQIPLLQGEPGPPVYAEKESIISTMQAAGYDLIHGYDFLPYHYFLEFKRKY